MEPKGGLTKGWRHCDMQSLIAISHRSMAKGMNYSGLKALRYSITNRDITSQQYKGAGPMQHATCDIDKPRLKRIINIIS